MPSKRITRRRGRAPHAADSDDDELVRAAQTDSDDSNDSLDESDESDSDSEPISRHLTPNTSHSPDADEKPAPFFAATPAAWADMMDDPASLPVITFGELDAHAVRKVRMAEPVPDSDDDEPEADQPVASSSRHSPAPAAAPPFPRHSHSHSQSARQAYQQRLDSDPSFVPVVGEFWGHDDRLLDKDLRSLSGWWRGRWQGRGRARGGVFRGRGAFPSPTQQHPLAAPDTDPAPVDRTWTHDGFEEMRRREDTRVRPQQQPQQHSPLRGGFRGGAPAFRGRGGVPLGRGMPGRTWFAMKPEHMWTKQHDAFLYFDPALKARPGHPPAVRVRLPGGKPAIVRAAPARPYPPRPAPPAPSATEPAYVVRLPRAGKGRAPPPPPTATRPDEFTVKLRPTPASALVPPRAPSPPPPANPLQPDADGWVRPDPAALAALTSPPSAAPPALPLASPPLPPPQQQQQQPQQQQQQPQQPSFYPFYPFAPPMAFHPHANTPPPPFAPFGTPPGFNAPLSGFSTPLGGFNAGLPPLPPGVGLDARGMPFELASGRAVVLQAPVFNPAFVPGHHHQAPISGHHSQTSMSMSGGHAHSMSHSMGGGGLGPELFAFARGARVEIRAPGSAPPPAPPAAAASTPVDAEPKSPTSPKDGKSPQSAQAPKLRTGAAAFVPSSSSASSPGGQGLGYYVPAYDYGSGAGAGHENGNGGAAADYGPGHENGNGGNGYVGTQYYYPYYAGPGQQEQGMGMGHEQGMSMGGQQEALPPMGTV